MSDHTRTTIHTPDETAAQLLSSPRTLERWRCTGKGPAFVKIGRRVGYTTDAIREFVQRRTKTHTRQQIG